MEKSEVKGIFKGPIIPATIKLAIPILISNLSMLLYLISDTLFVAHIDISSTSLLSGLGFVTPLFVFFMALATSIMVGASVIVGRAIGEKNRELLNVIPSSAVFIVFFISIPVLFLGYLFGESLIQILAGSEVSNEALSYGLKYFQYLLPGFVLQILMQLLMGILQGEGKTKIRGRAALMIVTLNIILDPLFIFVFDLGIRGAGLATTVAITITLVYVIRYFIINSSLPHDFHVESIKKLVVKEVFRIGFPHLIMSISPVIILLFFNKFISGISEPIMNAWVIVGRMNQLVMIPITSISTATLPMVSQNFGRNQLDRIQQIFSKNLILAMGFFIVVAAVYAWICPWLFSFFSSNVEAVEAAVLLVRFLVLFWVLMVVINMVEPVFMGVGKPLPPLIVGYTRVFISILMGYIFMAHYGMELGGVICALAIGFIVAGVLSFIWLKIYFSKMTYQKIDTRMAKSNMDYSMEN